MSGIYISKMQLPKDVWLTLRIYPSGAVAILDQDGVYRFHDIAIPVPDHGRLIDADALEYEEVYLNGHYALGDVEIIARGDIESAPTIIPADKE